MFKLDKTKLIFGLLIGAAMTAVILEQLLDRRSKVLKLNGILNRGRNIVRGSHIILFGYLVSLVGSATAESDGRTRLPHYAQSDWGQRTPPRPRPIGVAHR